MMRSSKPKIDPAAALATELDAARHHCALFNLRDLVSIQITGKDAKDLLHRLTMNEIRKLQPGEIVVNVFTDAKGRVREAFFHLQRQDCIELISFPGRAEAVLSWLDRYTFIEQIRCRDETAGIHFFLLTGQEALQVLALDTPPSALQSVTIHGAEIEIVQVGGLLPNGLLLRVRADEAPAVREALLASNTCLAASEQAFHALRIDQGIPWFGTEIVPGEVNPYEAGLKAFISYTKGCYIGQEVIARLDTYDKVKHEFARLHCQGYLESAPPLPILAGGKEAGVLSSFVQWPDTPGRGIALGRIRRKVLQEQERLVVLDNGREVEITVVSSTFTS